MASVEKVVREVNLIASMQLCEISGTVGAGSDHLISYLNLVRELGKSYRVRPLVLRQVYLDEDHRAWSTSSRIPVCQLPPTSTAQRDLPSGSDRIVTNSR